ncbi:MAG: hypothetical protein ACI4IM_05430 [Acutalibacteraceae bacterium]
MSEIKKKVLDLDGAGIIYPYVSSEKWNSVYRIEVKIKESVNLERLSKAIAELYRKYPYFFMTIGETKKKYYLKECEVNINRLYGEDNGPCKPFNLKLGEPLIRFLYSDQSIKLEMFHSLTDGRGAIELMKAFLKEYFTEGASEERNELLDNTEDIFDRIYKTGGKNVSRLLPDSFQIGREHPIAFSFKTIEMPSSSLIDAAHRYGVSVAVFLCALHIKAIADTRTSFRRKICISVPVELRKRFNFMSCRNSSLYFLVDVNQEETIDFKSLIETVRKKFKENINIENMRNIAYTNVKSAKMKAFELLPLSVKSTILKFGYKHMGENQFSSALTDIGVIKLDENLSKLVEDIYFVLGKQVTHPINIAASTYKEKAKMVVSYDIESDFYINALKRLIGKYVLCN